MKKSINSFVLITMVLVILTIFMAGCVSSDEKYLEGKALFDTGDYDSALPVLKEAANGGNTAAMCLLGDMYSSNKYHYYYPEKAIDWYN